MDHPANDHAEQHEVHLPDPSIWPLVVGFAAFVLGAALIFYSRDRTNDFAGPLLGAAAVFTLFAGCGWAYEDGRMKKKAEEGDHTRPRNARYTQVVTFAIPEGQYVASRQDTGVIALLEARDNTLRNLDGFQDLRVIVSPAESGPSQVLVETTWADRERLATYEETRKTMLDILSQSPDMVVPGSVQVFDMEVVRDTKDTSFTFGLGPMVATFGALIVGGFMVGAGLNMFSNDKAGGGGGTATETPGGAVDNVITAKNTKFITGTTITAPPNTAITLKFDNKDTSPPHNVEIYAGPQTTGSLLKGCTAGCEGADVSLPLKGGPEVIEFTFTTPAAGEYAFNCVAHPTQMVGKLIIKDGAPVPGGGGAAPAASATTAAK
jgi:plastocyanin/heme-degrading monooxygenase HmoA